MSHSPFGQSNVKIQRTAQPRPLEATLNDFSGGLNLTDSDLKIKTNFAKVLDNLNRGIDGTLAVRWGTKFKWDIAAITDGDIIEMVYFRDKLVCFTANGHISTIDGNGTQVVIWNTAIAAALPGAPAGWSTGLTIIDSTEFKNELIVTNGINKPVIISKTHTVKYLQDVPTGSNVFVPIGKFVTTVGNYTIIAGIAATPDVIYISAAGTSGTWPGDAAPNDSLSINIASYSADTGGDLRGLSSFRNMLLVHFATSTIVLVLGEYEAAVHIPRVLDTVSKQGIVSHRMSIGFNEEVITADEKGVYKSIKNAFGTGLENDKLSGRIQPEYIADVPTTEADRLKSFAVLADNENSIMFFLKQTSGFDIYVVSYDEGFKRRAWSTYSGWDWKSAATSRKGRVYFSLGTKVYQMGNEVFPDEDFTGDLMHDNAVAWLTATSYDVDDLVLVAGECYICVEDHLSLVFADDLEDHMWEVYEGVEISFDWELPWTDTNTRMRKKRLSYIGIDTSGEATFTLEAYIDNFRFDINLGDDPAITTDFVAGSSLGYGGGNNPYYGGGRRAVDERLWGFPCEFKILKLRVKGSTTRKMKFVAITLLYTRGTYKR